jgi:hypothetical protein
MKFEKLKEIVLKKYLKRHNIRIQTEVFNEEERYFDSELDRHETITTKKIIIEGSLNFEIRYTEEYKKYFLDKIVVGVGNVNIAGDNDPEVLLSIIDAIIKSEYK